MAPASHGFQQGIKTFLFHLAFEEELGDPLLTNTIYRSFVLFVFIFLIASALFGVKCFCFFLWICFEHWESSVEIFKNKVVALSSAAVITGISAGCSNQCPCTYYA